MSLLNLTIDPLKTEHSTYSIQEFSAYIRGNTLHFRYKNQPVNSLSGNTQELANVTDARSYTRMQRYL